MSGQLINHPKDNDCPRPSQAIPGGHVLTAHLLLLPQTRLKRSKGQELCPETVRLLVQLSILRTSFYEEPQFLPLPLRGPSQHGPLRTLRVSEQLRVHRARTCASLMMSLLGQPGLSSLKSSVILGAPSPCPWSCMSPGLPAIQLPTRISLLPWCVPTMPEG